MGGLAALSTPAAAHPGHDHPAPPPPPASRFQKVTLNDRPGEPMSLAVLPDSRVLHTARTGEVRLHNPRTGLNTLAADVPVYQHDEEGLQGVAIDPDFPPEQLGLPLLLAAARHPGRRSVHTGRQRGRRPFEGTEADFARFRGVLRLSRFKLVGDELALNTEQKIIDVPVDRGICCHVGGQIDFDGKATSSCPPVTTPTRSSPTGSPRSTTGPAATRPSTPAAPPATPTTCAASCCGSG